MSHESCDLHPDCQSQGCESDPAQCRRVRDLRAQEATRDIAFESLDEAGKFAKLQYHLREHPDSPVPSKWVLWLLQYIRPPTVGPGVLVWQPLPRKSGWERK